MKQSINAEKVQELRELDEDSEVLKELIRLFLPSTEEKLIKLAQLPSQTEIKAMAHEMRSSCANMGADKLSELATKLEYLQHEENYQKEASDLVEQMNSEFQIVKKYFLTL